MTMTWLKKIPTVSLLNKKASEIIPNLTIELVNAYAEELKSRINIPPVNPLDGLSKGILFDKAMKELKSSKIAGEVEVLTNKELPKKIADILANFCNTTEYLLRIYDEIGQDHELSHRIIKLLQEKLPKEVRVEILQSTSIKNFRRKILVYIPNKHYEKVKTEMKAHSLEIIDKIKDVPPEKGFLIKRFLEETTIEMVFVEEEKQ